MRALGLRGSVLLVGAVLALSACNGPSPSPAPSSSSSSSSSSATRPTLPTATGTAAPLTVGPPLWSTSSRRLPGFEAAAVVDGAAVLVGSAGVAAVDARSGTVLWSHGTRGASADLDGDDLRFSPFTTANQEPVTTAAAGVGQLVLVGYSKDGDRQSQGLAALSLRTGRLVWTASLSKDYESSPIVRVAGTSATNVLIALTPKPGSSARESVARSLALDAATGKVRWQRDNLLAWQLSGETAVLTDATGTQVDTDPARATGPLVGLDATTARPRWRIPNPYGNGRVDSATDRTVMIGNAATVLLDTTTGRALWRSPSDAYCDADGHTLVACQSDGRLVSWSTTDPVVRRSAHPVEGLVRRVEAGRVYLHSPGEPDAVVDVSGRSLVTAPLTDEVLAAAGGIAIVTSTAEYSEGVVSARPVRS